MAGESGGAVAELDDIQPCADLDHIPPCVFA